MTINSDKGQAFERARKTLRDARSVAGDKYGYGNFSSAVYAKIRRLERAHDAALIKVRAQYPYDLFNA